MAQTIKIKRGQKSSLPVLLEGELGYTTDTNEVYIGDGTNNYKFISENDIVTSISDPGSDSVIPSEQAVRESLYTDSDVDAHLTGGTGISYSSGTISVIDADIDHGSVSGLADDDHTQYLLANGTRDVGGDMNWTGSSAAQFGSSFEVEYNSDSESLDFNYIG